MKLPRSFRSAASRARVAARRRLSLSRDRVLLDQIRDSVFITRNARLIDVNRSAERILGYTRAELLELPVTAIYADPSVRDEMLAIVERQGHVDDFPLKARTKSGALLDCTISIQKWVDPDGSTMYEGVVHDITESKRIADELRRSVADYRGLFENAHDAILVLSADDQVVLDANPQACLLYGLEREELIGRPMLDFFVDAESAQTLVRDTIEADGRYVPFRSQQRSADRRTLIVEIHSALIHYRGRPALVSINRDITEQKRLEEDQRTFHNSILAIAREWRETFDALDNPVILLDDDGYIRRANRAASELAELPFGALVKMTIHELRGEPWESIANSAAFWRKHNLLSPSRVEDKQSSRVWQVSVTEAAFSEVHERRLIAVVHDITLITRLEESLRRVEMAAALGSLISGVAHEVRNPLFTISATLDVCEARLGSHSEFRHYLAPLRGEIERLSVLMQELLEYGKPHPLTLESVPLREVIDEAIAHYASRAAAANVKITVRGETGETNLDPDRMTQVFQNLIENAIQHSPAAREVTIELTRSDGWLEASVRDEGSGFPPDELERCIEPFYTRRKGGTGLGLAIVNRIVIAHGGRLLLRNRPAGGAEVVIALPAT